MAANFWVSSHCRNWTSRLTPEILDDALEQESAALTVNETRAVRAWVFGQMQALGKALKLRQQVVATAIVYWRRFFLFNTYEQHDPTLVAVTAIHLAAKVEECAHRAETVLSEWARVASDDALRYTHVQLLETEFHLVGAMNADLIIFHAYRPLLQLLTDARLEDACARVAWNLANDAYRTDACMLYPPYVVALGCVHMACQLQRKDVREWFAQLNVSMDEVKAVATLLLSLYDQHSEEEVQDAPSKLARVLSSG